MIAGGYLTEEPECTATPRNKPESRHQVSLDGGTINVPCSVHGTLADASRTDE